MAIPEWAGTRLLDSVCSEPYSALACPPSDLRDKQIATVRFLYLSRTAFLLLSDLSYRSPTNLLYSFTPPHFLTCWSGRV